MAMFTAYSHLGLKMGIDWSVGQLKSCHLSCVLLQSISKCYLLWYCFRSFVQGVHSMEGKLFGRTEEEKRRQRAAGIHALLSCQEECAKLKKCFRESWFGWCSEEHKAFWSCFQKVRTLCHQFSLHLCRHLYHYLQGQGNVFSLMARPHPPVRKTSLNQSSTPSEGLGLVTRPV